MTTSPLGRLACLLLFLAAAPAAAQTAATRAVFLDKQGVIRWRDDRSEVRLFGANYVLPTASDYRAAGYLNADRKAMITEDMAQFARMGWDGLRLTFWGDWESSDSAGNLLETDHLDLLDWLVAKARERGVYLLFSPIQLYNAKWPDALSDTTAPGFGRHYDRGQMGTDPAAIQAQVRYLDQILRHVNRYTGVAYKDEPAIVFIELVNEPWHHPEDLPGSIRYLNALVDAVRKTGCRKLIFYNISQDFAIGTAILGSRVEGLTFGWYPSALNAGHELAGNFLRAVDDYPDMRRPELARLPRIVYEFDSPDLRTGTMYPAMARTFRSVGAQFAAMFAYDMLQTASRNLAWQTHYLNLVYTPRKAMSAIIAAEAMRRLPSGQRYGGYPANTRFGDFRVSNAENLGELVARDAFLNAGATTSVPPDPASLTRVAGYGSSPVVRYEGEGIYFLDRVRPGLWRLEVYPDAVPVADPFEPPSPAKLVTRALSRAWPMTITLPDLGTTFTSRPLTAGNQGGRATDGQITVTPGVYLLSRSATVDTTGLPAMIGRVGLAEFHAPPPDQLAPVVTSLAPASLLTGSAAALRFRIVDALPPDSAKLFIRKVAGPFYRGHRLEPAGGYEFLATIPAEELAEGPYEYLVTLYRGTTATSFPERIAGQPWDWNFGGTERWRIDVADPETPLTLFDPLTDASQLAFSRIGDAGRRGLFQLGTAQPTGRPVFRFALPVTDGGWSPPDYTASLAIVDRIAARDSTLSSRGSLAIRLRGLGASQQLRLGLMENDGTTWLTTLTVESGWREVSVPLASLTAGKGVLLPEGFPGEWNYWVGPAIGRGGAKDQVRAGEVERLQLSLRPEGPVQPDGYGVEIEWIRLEAGSKR